MNNRFNVQPITPLSVTIRDACKVTGLGRSKIYELIADGRLAMVKVDKRTLIPYAELERLVSRPIQSDVLHIDLAALGLTPLQRGR